jgi:lipopolysaccharide biosynthesis regulator YciM
MNRAEELRTLANLHVENSDYETALEYARRALMIQERAVGRDNLALAPFIHELAMIHAALDHDGEARNLLGRLLRVVPTQHPLVAEVDLIVSELERARTAA